MLLILYLRSLDLTQDQRFSILFSSRSFIVLDLTFKAMIHFEFMGLYSSFFMWIFNWRNKFLCVKPLQFAVVCHPACQSPLTDII